MTSRSPHFGQSIKRSFCHRLGQLTCVSDVLRRVPADERISSQKSRRKSWLGNATKRWRCSGSDDARFRRSETRFRRSEMHHKNAARGRFTRQFKSFFRKCQFQTVSILMSSEFHFCLFVALLKKSTTRRSTGFDPRIH